MILDSLRVSGAHDSCIAVLETLARIGDKWNVVTLMQLAEGPRRFNELKGMVGNISQRMLTRTLRHLERDGLVKRTVFPTIPPRVDYELTQLGHSLRAPMMQLGAWVAHNQVSVEAARRAFDARDKSTLDELGVQAFLELRAGLEKHAPGKASREPGATCVPDRSDTA